MTSKTEKEITEAARIAAQAEADTAKAEVDKAASIEAENLANASNTAVAAANAGAALAEAGAAETLERDAEWKNSAKAQLEAQGQAIASLSTQITETQKSLSQTTEAIQSAIAKALTPPKSNETSIVEGKISPEKIEEEEKKAEKTALKNENKPVKKPHRFL